MPEIPDDPVRSFPERFLLHRKILPGRIDEFECEIHAGAVEQFDVEADRIRRTDLLQIEHDLLQPADYGRLAGLGNLPAADAKAVRLRTAFEFAGGLPAGRVVELHEGADDAAAPLRRFRFRRPQQDAGRLLRRILVQLKRFEPDREIDFPVLLLPP